MLVRTKLGHIADRGELSPQQAGRIASRNNFDAAAAKDDNHIELPPGTVVHIDDLWQGNKGRLSFVPQLEALAAQCGAVIRYPDDDTADAHFVVPFEHGGARPGAGRPALADATIRFSVTLTQEQADWLASVGPSRAEALRALIDAAMKEHSHADMS